MIRKYITGGKQPEQASVPSTGASTQSPSINTGNFYNSAIGQTANVFALNLLPNIFGNSLFGNLAQGVMGSILESGAQSLLNKNPKFDFSNLNSSIAGYGAGLIGNGIESIGGHSKTAKFLGGASSSALGSLGSNLLNSGSLSIANPTAFGMLVVGAGLQSAIGPSKEYGGKYGAVTKTIDLLYDAATGVAGAANPIVGGAMVLNKGLSNLFGSTDGMTLQDAILGSAAMPAPVKWLNMAGAKKTGTFNNYSWQNQEDVSGLLGSYGNIESRINKAMNEAGKTYGTFSRGAYKRARNNLAFANQAWDKLTAMADESELETIRSSKMDTVNTGRYAQSIQGGLQPYYRGKHGMKFPKLQSGGYITNLRSRISTIADNAKKRGRNLADLITYAEQVNPRFIQRLLEPVLRYISDGENGIKSHKLSYTTVGDNKAIVYPLIQEGPFGDLFEIQDSEGAYERALKNGDYLEMAPSEAELFTTEYKTYKPWKDLIDGAIKENENNLQLYRNALEQLFLSPYEQFFLRVYKDGGTLKKKKRIKLVGEDFEEGEYIEVDSLDSDLKAGRKPIGKDKKGRDIFLNGDGNGVLNQNGKLTAFKEGGIIDFLLKGNKVKKVRISTDDPKGYRYDPEENTIYYGGNTRKEVKESKKHEMFHANPNEGFIEFLRPYYEDLDDNKIQELGGDLDFVKRIDGDPNRFYSPEEIGARVVAARYRAGNKYFTPEFFRNLRGPENENKYGDNMRDLLHMYNDDILSKIFKKADSLYTAWGGLSSNGQFFKDPNGVLGDGKILKSTGEYDESGRELWESEDGDLFTLKSGGVLNQNKEGEVTDLGDYDFMTGALSFRKGGSMNIIPEGALHARKHHMADSEKLTLKGIPVVDNDGNQQAEIECNEIIFRKEVTDKIEKLRKEFEEASGSKKDEIAILCGKLLTKEIINNTDDRTGLLKVVENDIT